MDEFHEELGRKSDSLASLRTQLEESEDPLGRLARKLNVRRSQLITHGSTAIVATIVILILAAGCVTAWYFRREILDKVQNTEGDLRTVRTQISEDPRSMDPAIRETFIRTAFRAAIP